MRDLSKYDLTKLGEDGEFVLWRAVSAGDPPLLVHAPASPRLTPAGMVRLQRALALGGELDSTWAARPLELVDYNGGPALVSEDPGPDLLARRMGRPWAISDFLRIAVGLAAALRRLHARGLIHKDIKPANVLADVSRGDVWLTGFGFASRLPRERQAPEPPEVIAGTLAYMAPEQTGRMNRSVDSRSDLYALGMTFYELLAGKLPFAATDPMEWVHCHVARQPAPLGGAIPGPLWEIIRKLLAKTAEERYQTAAGVEYDLRRAREEWESTQRIEVMVPGRRDASDRLLLPEKLYGRDTEIDVLLASFERVVSGGETELVLVSGYSGIGKSAVVNELHKMLVPPRGIFASGKFDQYKRDIPYATLAQAFQVLIRQVLGKSDEEIALYREKIAAALGSNGQLIANLVPELELIIGKPAPVADLPPREAQARFQAVVQRFLGVFARPEHPLALFLDDLQWLDAATLDLLEHLLGAQEIRHLLLVGAYRDNEVGPTHPLARTLEKLRRQSGRVRDIVLSPLAVEDLARLCGEGLRVDAVSVRPLAQLVHEKTGGNPFFAIQFITALVDERLLLFEAETGSWTWDVSAIRGKGFTDNVVELMSRKLERLPSRTRGALRQLACLGHSVRLATLSLVYDVPEESLHDALWDVVRAGLVIRAGGSYAFLHDRVHEAAYAMIPEAERAAEHLRIGSILADRMSSDRTASDELMDNVFEIVNHLNRGAGLIGSTRERERVAELNLMASRRAKASTANAAAHAYAAFGRSLLDESCWHRSYRLIFDLELQLADCEFLTGDLAGAEERLDRLGEQAVSLPDRAAVIYVQTVLYTAMAERTDRAIQLCLAYLRHVGIEWAPHPSDETVHAEYQALLARIGGRSIEELATLPREEDPDRRATIDVLLGLLTPAFNSDQGLVCLILCRMANLSLAHGNSEASPLGYAFLGMALGCRFGDYRTGYLFGQLALDLVENRGITRYRGRVHHTLGTHVLPWTQHFASAQPWLRRGIKAAHESGDVTYEGFGYVGLVTNLINSGEALERVQAEAEIALALTNEAKFEMGIDHFTVHLRLVRALRGLLADPCTLEDGGRRFVGDLTRSWFWIRTMQACFIFGDHRAALAAAQRAEPVIGLSSGFFELPEFHWFAALIKAACFDPSAARGEQLAAITAHRQQLLVWAEHCPENFGHRLALVDAEIARIEGRPLDAMEAYEESIRSARQSGFVHYEALAAEVASRFYAARGFETIARAYLQSARSGYLRWGAVGKVRYMDRAHEAQPDDARQPPMSAAIEARSAELDLATVVRTSRAVTGEIGLPKLIETLMVIALEHAGADRGLLVISGRGEHEIEAEASTAADGVVSVRFARGVARHPEVPEALLYYVSRTREIVLLDDAQAPHAHSTDPYFRERQARSVVCIPLVKQAELVGVLYLENSLTPHVFTNARIAVLQLLASQAATSLENASLEEENASLAEKESLLKEVHHRVKNNLQLISSLLSLQASRVTDPLASELFAESRDRVRSIALVHENLYRAGNFARIAMAAHVRTLCAHLGRAYGLAAQNVHLVTRVSDVHLEMNRAVTCGLIINELVSNALKHAFSDGRPGHVWVDLRNADDGANVLVVGDDGVGLASGLDLGRSDSLGLRLVRDLTDQLNGDLKISRDAGTTFTITFRDRPGDGVHRWNPRES